ncbi:hypothetical protein [Pseudomonas aeruginosa]|uniref:hypothetical protein n=1 Tax=Pseudomonas aeruginosa TaxID=287 RepID=UPI000774E84C|nr:hypothetical protein [Pseudomonas aeruginosa]RTR52966.1 hypothetical protein DY931_33560 [Pseudomonas aeruginosa]RTR64192.1 hypothetical protein DY930_34215 [Pseudomonas aeruginosa]
MLEANLRISMLPADMELLRKIGTRARDIGSLLSPDELLTARYIENLLMRLVTPILTEGVAKTAEKAETIYRLQREIGDAATIISPPELKTRLFLYLLPLVGGDRKDADVLLRLLFPREIAIDQ